MKFLRTTLALVMVVGVIGIGTGCSALVRELGPLNLQEQGWTTLEGVAVWKAQDQAPELTGDVLMSMHSDGRAFVQFSKGLPILSGQRTPDQWQVEIPAENKSFRGKGKPPRRLIWLHLPEIFMGAPAPKHWKVVTRTSKELDLYHEDRGERLHLIFE